MLSFLLGLRIRPRRRVGWDYLLRDDGGKNMGKRREHYQKRASCYRQLLCAAAAAGERPSRSCASTWHFFGAGVGVGAPSGTGAGVASGWVAENGS